MKVLDKTMTNPIERPIKVVQFGEGNFLRGFVDYMLDIANEKGLFDGSIVLIKPIEFGNLDGFHAQNCQYTVSLRGIVDGEPKVLNRMVTSVKDAVDSYTEYDKYMELATIDTLRFVVSNTTEAGIVFDDRDKLTDRPAGSFPGKLTQLLLKRYELGLGGFVFLPCELIDKNGDQLKRCILEYADLWSLGDGFKRWIENENIFCINPLSTARL